MGVNFSPDYRYRTLTKNNNGLSNWPYDLWITQKNMEDSINIPKFNYTTGINFGFQINKLLSIETGIQYSNKGFKTIPIMTVYDVAFNQAMATNIINYSYFDFPLRANFSFLKKRIQILSSVGFVINFLQKVSVKTIPETPTATFKTITWNYNKINISPTVSVGLKYKINDKMSLRAEPTFRYGLLNIDDNSYKVTHLWSAGLNIGCLHKIMTTTKDQSTGYFKPIGLS